MFQNDLDMDHPILIEDQMIALWIMIPTSDLARIRLILSWIERSNPVEEFYNHACQPTTTSKNVSYHS